MGGVRIHYDFVTTDGQLWFMANTPGSTGNPFLAALGAAALGGFQAPAQTPERPRRATDRTVIRTMTSKAGPWTPARPGAESRNPARAGERKRAPEEVDGASAKSPRRAPGAASSGVAANPGQRETTACALAWPAGCTGKCSGRGSSRAAARGFLK